MHSIDIDAKDLFQAMADFTRVRILRLMLDSSEEICLCEFVDSLLEPQYNLSRHLKILRQAGLLSATKEGRWVYHGLVTGVPHIKNLYKLVSSLPDADRTFAQDFYRFGKRKKIRVTGRCKVEPYHQGSKLQKSR